MVSSLILLHSKCHMLQIMKYDISIRIIIVYCGYQQQGIFILYRQGTIYIGDSNVFGIIRQHGILLHDGCKNGDFILTIKCSICVYDTISFISNTVSLTHRLR